MMKNWLIGAAMVGLYLIVSTMDYQDAVRGGWNG